MIGLGLTAGLTGCFTDDGPQLTGNASAPTTSASEGSTSAGEATTTSTGESTTEPATTTTTTTTADTEGTTGDAPPIVRTCPNVDELVLCYEFEDGWDAGYLHDGSATAHHGLMDSVTRVVGHAGSAAALTESSSLYTPYDEQVFQRFNGAFTIAAWIHPEPGTLSGARGVIEREGLVILGINGNGETYQVLCNSVQATLPLLSKTELFPAAWNHVACVFDGATYSLWINGKLDSEAAADIVVLSNDPIRFGNDGLTPSPATALVGMIDELQLWEIALKDAALCVAAGIDPC